MPTSDRMKPRKINYPQSRLLRGVRDGTIVGDERTATDHGGANTTLSWAVRRGLIEWVDHAWRLTPLGTASLKTGRTQEPDQGEA